MDTKKVLVTIYFYQLKAFFGLWVVTKPHLINNFLPLRYEKASRNERPFPQVSAPVISVHLTGKQKQNQPRSGETVDDVDKILEKNAENVKQMFK